ncbi:MAG: hypothetical protein Tsb009_35960 [Planctomycetaceae bacterium]
MTELLEKAFAEASRLSSEEQDVLAAWLLDELDSDRRWEKTFSTSEDELKKLADEYHSSH